MKRQNKSIVWTIALAAVLTIVTAWPSAAQVPNLTPVNLGVLPDDFGSWASAINSSGQIAGVSYGVGEGAVERACVWQPDEVTPTALPLLDGYTDSEAWYINDAGQILGVSNNSSGDYQPQACLWQYVGGEWTVTGLGYLPGTAHNYSDPWSMNASGQVVGMSGVQYSDDFAGFIWDSTSGMQPFINVPDGADTIRPMGISDNGLVVGMAQNNGANVVGAIWDAVTQTTVAVLTNASPTAVSPSGKVAGSVNVPPSELYPYFTPQHVFVWENGDFTDLGQPDPVPPVAGATWVRDTLEPAAINDQGKILLYGYEDWDVDGDGEVDHEWDIDGDGELEDISAFKMWVWQDGGFTELASVMPVSVREMDAYCINAQGQVVGGALLSDGTGWVAFLWSGSGEAQILGGLGGTYSGAGSINNDGVVVGQSALTGDMAVRAVRWGGPVPPNSPPVADAGTSRSYDIPHDGDQSTDTVLVTLDGSGSYDPDGDALTYSWATNAVEIATGVSPSINLGYGYHSITLTVTDPYGDSDEATVYITVNPETNTGPAAEAGENQTVTAGAGGTATVTLDGTGSSDPEGDALTYQWSTNSVTIATGVQPSVNLAVGTHIITLRVMDAYSYWATDQVVVNVSEPPPVLTVGTATVARKGKTITVTAPITNTGTEVAYNVAVTAATLDNGTLTSSLPSIKNIRPGATKTVTLKFSASSTATGQQTFTLSGTSSLGAFSTTQEVTVP